MGKIDRGASVARVKGTCYFCRQKNRLAIRYWMIMLAFIQTLDVWMNCLKRSNNGYYS